MNATELKTRTLTAAHILSLRSVQKEMARHPDADWDIGQQWDSNARRYVPTIVGSICLGYVHPEAGDPDIRDVATGADSDSWTVKLTPIDRVLKCGARLRIELTAWQAYAKDEVEMLKGIGVLREVEQKQYSYTTLSCSIR